MKSVQNSNVFISVIRVICGSCSFVVENIRLFFHEISATIRGEKAVLISHPDSAQLPIAISEPRIARISRIGEPTRLGCWFRRLRRNELLLYPTPSIKHQTSNPPTHGFALANIKHSCSRAAFSLIELLVVMGVIGILIVLIVPAFTTIKGGSDVTSAANAIKAVLDSACTYAKSNNTYTWVGFFEENVASTTPGTAGIGRLVMSIVASKDGTDPTYVSPLNLTASLAQVGKLTKIDNVHLATFADGSGQSPGTTFVTRPPVTYTVNNVQTQYSLASMANSSTPFTFPSGSPYTFSKVVQFSPIGGARVNNSVSNYPPQPAAEIGIEPTHGNVVPSSTPANVFAIQFGGVGGDVIIYRQ